MNSLHDLGGMHGMGPLPFEENEPFFHHDWERRTLGLHLLTLMTGLFCADEARHSMERIPALHWLASPYFEHWLDGTEMLLKEKGILSAEEMAAGHAIGPLPDWAARLAPIKVARVAPIVTTNHPVTGPAAAGPAFQPGDRVRARNINPRGHTRLPRYVRGHLGTVTAYHAPCLYADARARGAYDSVDHAYAVRFEGAELWGPDAGARDALHIGLYETYLEKA